MVVAGDQMDQTIACLDSTAITSSFSFADIYCCYTEVIGTLLTKSHKLTKNEQIYRTRTAEFVNLFLVDKTNCCI